LVRIYPPG
jgi:hypothetical protein